jgi:hypothetical protein
VANLLYFFVAEDPLLMSRLPKAHRIGFAVAGTVAGLTGLLMFCGFAIMELHWGYGPVGAVLLSVLLTAVLFNMYRFALYTISKQAMPGQASGWLPTTVSFLLKYAYIVGIGILVSTPFNILFHRDRLEADVQQFKKETIQGYTRYLERITAERLADVEQKMAFLQDHPSIDATADLLFLEKQQRKAVEDHHKNLAKMEALINITPFYARRIGLLANYHRESALRFLLLFECLILLPALLRHILVHTKPYRRKKAIIDMAIVTNHYRATERHYADCLYEAFEKPYLMPSAFMDPPFNTQRYQPFVQVRTEEEFLKRIYGRQG